VKFTAEEAKNNFLFLPHSYLGRMGGIIKILSYIDSRLKLKIKIRTAQDYSTKSILPLEIVKAGDHCDLRISRQMLPLLLIFG
jgi:hypothetical protein